MVRSMVLLHTSVERTCTAKLLVQELSTIMTGQHRPPLAMQQTNQKTNGLKREPGSVTMIEIPLKPSHNTYVRSRAGNGAVHVYILSYR